MVSPDFGSRRNVVANVADHCFTLNNIPMSNTIVVAFSNQKGGVGKSTLTVLLASYLYYEKGIKVAIMDCDSPQHSLIGERNRELKTVSETEHLAVMAHELLTRTGLQPYAIMKIPLEETMFRVRQYLNGENDTQVLFLDLPGTMNNPNVIQIISNCDYVFCPMAACKYDIESTLGYCQFIHDRLMTMGYGNLKGVKILWNKVDARERTDLYTAYDEFMESIGLEAMKTTIPASVRFKKELSCNPKHQVFRSTVFPPSPYTIKGSGIDDLAEEFLELTGIRNG